MDVPVPTLPRLSVAVTVTVQEPAPRSGPMGAVQEPDFRSVKSVGPSRGDWGPAHVMVTDATADSSATAADTTPVSAGQSVGFGALVGGDEHEPASPSTIGFTVGVTAGGRSTVQRTVSDELFPPPTMDTTSS
jgi:hypothetical protein